MGTSAALAEVSVLLEGGRQGALALEMRDSVYSMRSTSVVEQMVEWPDGHFERPDVCAKHIKRH